jgi:hypothetical protein
MIAKRAQERIFLEPRAERLRVKRADTPPQARAPVTTSNTTVIITSAGVPRDEEGANKNQNQNPKKKRGRRVNALFVVLEERLDRLRIRQCAIERIESVETMFGAAGGKSGSIIGRGYGRATAAAVGR